MFTRFFIIAMLAWVVTAHANIVFVPDDFVNLQEALDESNSSDTVICRAGNYRGPFYIWARDITLGSEFLLTGNSIDISNCVIRGSNASPDNICLETQRANQENISLRIIGMTIQGGYNLNGDGGGIRIRRRNAEISNCIFKANLADRGGAIHADSSTVTLRDCLFQSNDAVRYGRCISGYQSEFSLYDCDWGPSGYLIADGFPDSEIYTRHSSFQFTRTRIHDLGRTFEGWTNFFWWPSGGAPNYIRFNECVIENCVFFYVINGQGSGGPRELVLDSCTFANNSLPAPFWNVGFLSANSDVTITNCLFENNTAPPNTAGPALLQFSGTNLRYVIEGNLFRNNYSGSVACFFVRGNYNPSQARIQRNFLVENSSWGYPRNRSTSVALDNVGEGVFEYNALLDNVGDAVYTSDYFSPTSYALHNFWGDSTGPYEATRNPGGLGDTTNAATIYDEWLLSEDEIPDTSLFPPPNAADDRRWTVPSTWFISSVYPNPFNSEFRIELDGMTGADFVVRLFDLLGREVALLHSGRTLRGTLSFTAPANLAAGIYFISAHDRFYSEAKKVLYLK